MAAEEGHSEEPPSSYVGGSNLYYMGGAEPAFPQHDKPNIDDAPPQPSKVGDEVKGDGDSKANNRRSDDVPDVSSAVHLDTTSNSDTGKTPVHPQPQPLPLPETSTLVPRSQRRKRSLLGGSKKEYFSAENAIHQPVGQLKEVTPAIMESLAKVDLARVQYPISVYMRQPGFYISSLSGLSAINAAALKELDISMQSLIECSGVNGFQNLKRVRLLDNGLEVATISLPRLKFLDLSGNKLEHVPDLTGCPNLQILSLSRNRIRGHLHQLRRCIRLKHISLIRNNISWEPPEIERETTSIQALDQLRELNFQGNPVVDKIPFLRTFVGAYAGNANLIIDGKELIKEERGTSALIKAWKWAASRVGDDKTRGELETLVSDLEGVIATSNHEHRARAEEVVRLNHQLTSLQGELEAIRSSRKFTTDKMRDDSSTLLEWRRSCEELSDKVKLLTTELQQLKEDRDDKELRRRLLEEQLRSSEDLQLRKDERMLSAKEELRLQLESDKRAWDGEKRRLQERLDGLITELDSYKSETSSLRTELSKYRTDLTVQEQLDDARRQVLEGSKKQAEMEKEMVVIQKEYKDMIAALEDLQRENARLNAKCEEQMKDRMVLEEEIRAKAKAVIYWKDRSEVLTREVGSIRRQNNIVKM